MTEISMSHEDFRRLAQSMAYIKEAIGPAFVAGKKPSQDHLFMAISWASAASEIIFRVAVDNGFQPTPEPAAHE